EGFSISDLVKIGFAYLEGSGSLRPGKVADSFCEHAITTAQDEILLHSISNTKTRPKIAKIRIRHHLTGYDIDSIGIQRADLRHRCVGNNDVAGFDVPVILKSIFKGRG